MSTGNSNQHSGGNSNAKGKVVSLNTPKNTYKLDETYFEAGNMHTTDYAKYGTPTTNLLQGGQWAHLPMIGDKNNKHAWMADQAYIRRDIIPVVLQVPKGFEYLPNGEYYIKACVALFEKHARTIEGLDSSITVNTGEHELGLEGAKYQEPVNVTVAESNVSISLTEKYGQAVKNFLDVWVRYLIMDPQTKSPLISQYLRAKKATTAQSNDGSGTSTAATDGKDNKSTLANGIALNNNVWSTEYYTMTILFIEPDILNNRVVNAWLVSNMFPRSIPNIIGKKDKKADKEIEELTIEFGGFALHSRNRHVRKMAQDMLDNLALYQLTNDNILPQAKGIDNILKSDNETEIQEYYDETAKIASTAYSTKSKSVQNPNPNKTSSTEVHKAAKTNT